MTWTLADSCGQCLPCTAYDLPQKCEHLFKYGHAGLSEGAGLNGTYATHILLRAGTHLAAIPDDLPDDVAAPANCALATMIAATEQLPSCCRTAVVQGAGLLGLYGCALLRAAGVERVIVVDADETRLAAVVGFGGEPAAHFALSLLGPKSADLVIECCGSPAVVPEGMTLLRPGGHYVFVGMVHPQSALNLTGEAVIRACATLRGIHNYAPRHLDAALAFLQRESRLPWATLASPPLPLERINEAFTLAASRRWGRVTVGM